MERDEESPAACTEAIKALRETLQADWTQFWRVVENAAKAHQRRQEDILAQCAGRLGDVGAGWQSSLKKSDLFLDFDGEGQKKPALRRKGSGRLRELSTNISLVSGPGGSPSSEAESGGDDSTCESVTGNILPTAETTTEATASVAASIKELEDSMKRVERILAVSAQMPVESARFLKPSKSSVSGDTPLSGGAETVPSGNVVRASRSSRRSITDEEIYTLEDLDNFSLDHNQYADEDDKDHFSFIRKLFFKFFTKFMTWWMSLEEPPRTGKVANMISDRSFEFICAAVILANGGFTIYTTNYQMEYLKEPEAAWVYGVEVFFLCFYGAELILKLWVHHWYFFVNEDCQWNIFDFVLVLFSIIDEVVSQTLGDDGNIDVTFMRSLRILKMAKILRGLRVVRFFSELRLMLNSLLGSLHSLFWSIVMLILIFYIYGLVFVQGAASFLKDNINTLSKADYDDLMATFGSTQIAMMTLYKTSTGGDDWSQFFVVAAMIGPLESTVFVIFVAFIQIALLNILTGIFVENAMKLAQPDRDALALEHRKKHIADAEELKRIFTEVGNTKDGTTTISLKTFMKALKKGKLCAHLSMLGLDVRDARLFFGMLAAANESTDVDMKTFVDGCMRLKGPATSIDMQSLGFQTKLIHRHLKRVDTKCTESLEMIDQLIEAEAHEREALRQAHAKRLNSLV